ncbi:sensor histidine kinase [Nonomuraea sp. K274]|uniref:histidine kinase n=1 Tax=Nonomuraea cypriaca TaxID=1187855 RepID=A0A931AAL2_9ACTN|nr:sensor histidine kinase [Nonomuraea cypriaca]MBF8186430.1 sensor histidine kinase [Nonomuraea cypriaca]
MRKDGLVVVIVPVALVAVTLLEKRYPPPGLAVVAGLSLAVCLPVLFWRRLPLSAAVMSAGVAVIGMTVSGWPGRLVATCLFCAAAIHPSRRPWLVLAASVTWVVCYGMLLPQSIGIATFTDLIVLGVAPVAIGTALRLHGERAAQAARLDHAEARRAMAEERAGLARDVHDSVGHHLTAIRMQATATRRALRGQTPAADKALGTIADLSSSALNEVRALLDTLCETPPEPDQEDIQHLARRLSTPRLRISVHRAGPGTPLPPGVGRTVYRIVQEALTNAARHSGATEVEVRVRRGRAAVAISITDNGHARAGAEGRGIRGMRERAHRHGGTLTAGPGPRQGWLVEAVVPIAEGSVSPEVGHARPEI